MLCLKHSFQEMSSLVFIPALLYTPVLHAVHNRMASETRNNNTGGSIMFAVIDKKTNAVLRTCNTKETAIIAAQLEKDKLPSNERQQITAVALDDGGYEDIMF